MPRQQFELVKKADELLELFPTPVLFLFGIRIQSAAI
jgi:hypothetical protein